VAKQDKPNILVIWSDDIEGALFAAGINYQTLKAAAALKRLHEIGNPVAAGRVSLSVGRSRLSFLF